MINNRNIKTYAAPCAFVVASAIVVTANVSALAEQGFRSDGVAFSGTLNRGDDNSSSAVGIGFTTNLFGSQFDSLYVNNNGNVSFGAASGQYTPSSIASLTNKILAPFWADVDTTSANGGAVRWGQTTVNGRQAFVANWEAVGYFNQGTNKVNTFQLVLINRSDRRAGDFDIEFNYRSIKWETGDASGGTNGLGGQSARAGYTAGTGQPGTYYEVPGSGVNGAFLDGSSTALAGTSNTGIPGRYLFQVSNGQVQLISFTPATVLSAANQQNEIRSSSTSTTRAEVRALTNVISQRIRALRGGTGQSSIFSASNVSSLDGKSGTLASSGHSGGDELANIGVWADGSYVKLGNTTSGNNFTGNSINMVLGADYSVLDNLVVGLVVGFTNSVLKLQAVDGRKISNGVSVSLYAGYLITDWLSASAHITGVQVRNGLNQPDAFTGDDVAANFHSKRLISSFELTAYQPVGPFDLSSTVGYTRSSEHFTSYTSSDNALVNPEAVVIGQVRFGGEAALNLFDDFQVFTNATWEWDHVHPSGSDPNGAIIGGGIRYKVKDNITVGIQSDGQILRSHDQQYTFGANARVVF